MKIRFGLCLAVLVTFCVGQTLLSGVRAKGQTSSETRRYEQNVPENMRDLVTKNQFSDIYSKLMEANRAQSGEALLSEDFIDRIASSPCGSSLLYLVTEYTSKPVVRRAMNTVVAGFKDPPASYGFANPWRAAANGNELLRLMLDNFTNWCVFLPEINGDQDNGLAYIQRFAWFYYRNPAAIDFVQGRNPLNSSEPLEVGLRFTEEFSEQRGEFMWSPASTKYIEQWIKDPRIEIKDYQKTKVREYTSWNEFFARQINVDKKSRTIPSRPASMPLSQYPKRDYIVVAPTDCIMNPLVQVLTEGSSVTRKYIENPLQYDTVLDVKGIPINLKELLGGVREDLKQEFVGGTGLSCVLMPNTYHHFHSPVNGTIKHAEVLKTYGAYGYPDWPNWVPKDGNVGRPGTDFSQFQSFVRGVVIIEVKYADLDGKQLTGYVASIPVGLDTIGSVRLDKDIVVEKKVKRGYTRLGNFYYGGSLNILLFSKGLASGVVQTRLGDQIAIFNVGKAPRTPKFEIDRNDSHSRNP